MSIRRIHARPSQFERLPAERKYKWYELRLGGKPYAVAALARLDDDLELHFNVLSWGPQSCREMGRDMEWLKELARRLGCRRIMGMRVDSLESHDPKWPRFTKMFGFGNHAVVQTAWVDV